MAKKGTTIGLLARGTMVVYHNYKKSSIKRGLVFNLPYPIFQKLLTEPCIYCGIQKSNSVNVNKLGRFEYNGIDRWDNSKGYEEDNCVPCCLNCNRIKNKSADGSVFIEQIKRILDYHQISFKMTESKIKKYELRVNAIRQNSPDEETKVAAILIDSKTGAVIAEGYNGFARGAPDHLLPKTRPGKYKYMIHAERNLICNASRAGIGGDGQIMFCSLSPCMDCCRALYQCGITTIYFKEKYRTFEEQLDQPDLQLIVEECFKEYYKLTIKPQTEEKCLEILNKGI